MIFYCLVLNIICTFLVCRSMSRGLLIPFSGPSVGPGSLEEEEAYEELQLGLQQNEYSSCIGFVINTISNLQKGKDDVKNIKSRLCSLFPAQPRILQGWSIALYYTQKVKFILMYHETN